jgi:hypothetical protein
VDKRPLELNGAQESDMRKIFHTYIKKYQFIPPERLYDEFIEYFETEFTERDSTIYLIVKCKKPRWIEGSIKFLRDYRFEAKIEVDNKIHKVIIDMAEFWFSMPQLHKHFQNKYAMANYIMSRSTKMPWRFLPPDLRYKFLSSVNGIEQEGKLLKINCEISKNSNIERKSLTEVFLYQAINIYDLPQPKLDIIYIGSSLKGTFSRLQKHEKWGWIQAQKGYDEDLLVYFCEIEGDQFQVSNTSVVHGDHRLSREDETLITEMALINYFKPKKYNDKHVRRDIRHSDRVKTKLVNQGFNQVCVEMLLEGNIAKLGSQHVPEYKEHIIYHEIT